MYKILTLNNISVVGLEKLPRDHYEIASEIKHPDAILLRSYKMHGMALPESVRAIGRAGAGVNNIPVDQCSSLGIPVFNAPGANSNAVKELVLAGMLLAARNICPAWEFARHVEGDDASLNQQVEAGKKNYVGFELPGRTLGVIGLGAIGVKVANAALSLGMNVIGFDPQITVKSAWQLSSSVQQANSVDELLNQSDMVSLHVPEVDATRGLISKERLENMKDGLVVLNFARAGIVDNVAVLQALQSGKMHSYVCDFPCNLLKNQQGVIALPHLGASTKEAEENCAIMVADQIREFLENGNIVNSVNFPEVVMPRTEGYRIAISNTNVPNMLGQISTALAKSDLNIVDMINKSKGDIAYTMADVDKPVPKSVIDEIASIQGVLSVRSL
ncbi:MAG: phosphoglycerate dehydrogenase [Gammaproteobacteria bacterium]|nr:phosphoglycerate dehydrogenase [Gammaproteobacteria bacterium]